MGQAEQPQKPEDPNIFQEPNRSYIDILRVYLTEDYKTCPWDRFGLSNIPVCFNDIYRDQRMLPTPPYGHTLLGVIPGACMHEFFFSFFFFGTRGFNESHLLTKTSQSPAIMSARMVTLVLRKVTFFCMNTYYLSSHRRFIFEVDYYHRHLNLLWK